MRIIGLAGYAGAGKDTAAQCLIDLGWLPEAFADPLKAIALASDPIVGRTYQGRNEIMGLSSLVDAVGWDEAKKESDVRRYLQNLGSAVRTHLGEDTWVRALEERIADVARRRKLEPAPRETPRFVVKDVRYKNEAQWTARKRNIHQPILIWISRPGVGPVNMHESDQGQAREWCTHEIDNDGTPEDLWRKVLEVVG